MKNFSVIALLLINSFVSHAVLADSYGQAATVNGVGISRNRLQAGVDTEIAGQGVGSGGITQPSRYNTIQSRVLEKLITQEILWQHAEKNNYVADEKAVEEAFNQTRAGYDSEMAFQNKIIESGMNEKKFYEDIKHQLSISKMLKAEVEDKLVITSKEVETFYQENLDKMSYPLALRARHILIRVPQDATKDEIGAAQIHVDEILQAIKDGADFAETAKKESEDQTAANGGDLGYFAAGQMVPDFEKAAMALEVGEVSEPVRTVFGFHLIKLEEKKGGEAAPLTEVESQIREFLMKQKTNQRIVKFIEELRDEADVEILVY